mmetsp:Transcript_25083/g.52931  ORF Transcript_25083/g.52931 Transcript_25083/m.52931 type:complete len:200 (-) Transcript_25083:85-684(-)
MMATSHSMISISGWSGGGPCSQLMSSSSSSASSDMRRTSLLTLLLKVLLVVVVAVLAVCRTMVRAVVCTLLLPEPEGYTKEDTTGAILLLLWCITVHANPIASKNSTLLLLLLPWTREPAMIAAVFLLAAQRTNQFKYSAVGVIRYGTVRYGPLALIRRSDPCCVFTTGSCAVCSANEMNSTLSCYRCGKKSKQLYCCL